MSAKPEASNASTSSSIVQAILTGNSTNKTTQQLNELLNGRPKQTSSNATSPRATTATPRGHARAKSTAIAPSRPAARTTDATKRAHTSRAKSVDLRQPAPLMQTALDGHAKECLATEVVNAVLKALTIAVKSQRSTVGPLTETSDNARETPVGRAKKVPRDAATTTLLQTAECGRVALSYLRLQTAGGDAPWSLVGGMLAFIGRLIVLNLTSIALAELKPVKSFLCGCLLNDGGAEPNPNRFLRRTGDGDLTKSDEVTDVASMIDFSTLDIPDQALPHIIDFQSHVLVLCTRSGCRSSEGVQRILHKTQPASPHSLLLRKHELDANFERSLRQMETFAQGILGLARALANTSLTDDAPQVMSPQSILQLRLVALEMRMDWMQRAGHEADLDKEIFGPLASWIEIYTKQDRTVADVQLGFLKDALSSVEKNAEGLKTSKASKTTSQCPGHIKIRLYLSRLAEKAGRKSESREWTQPSSHTPNGAHEVQAVECTLVMRNTAIALNSVTEDLKSVGEAESAVNTCARILSGQVNGTQAELVSLFTELNTLRKVATIKLRFATDKARDDTPASSSYKLRLLSCTALFALVPFVTRIAGTCGSNNANSKIPTSSVMSDLVTLSQACIKSVLTAIDKVPVSTTDLTGARTAAQQCLELAASLGLEKDSSSTKPTVRSVRVLASNMFSSLYQRTQKQAPGAHGDALDALHFSCQLLEAATSQEKQEGQLQTKLQHLGRLLENRGAVKDALAAYTKSLRIAVDDGVLSRLSDRTGRDPLQGIIHDTPQAVSFAKSLEAAMKLAAKLSDLTWAQQLSTELKFSDEAYGLWMEWQLVILNSSLRSEKQSSYRTSIAKRLVNELLQVYDPALYPIRRARSIARALRTAARDPSLMDAAAKMIASDEFPDVDSSKDSSLSRYLDTWTLIIKTLLAFNSPSRTVEDLQAVSRSWQKVSHIEEEPVLSEFEDEETLMATLGPVATYFEGQALHTDQLSVSLLMLHHAPRGRSNPYLLNLARSLHQLGHNDCATEVLARVEMLAEENPSPSSVIAYHLLRLDVAISAGQLDHSSESALAVGLFLDSFTDTTPQEGNRRLDFEETLLRARCYHIYSAVLREQGDVYQSLRCSRNSVRWFQRLWRSVDPSKSRGASASAVKEEESDLESLVADVSNMTIKDSAPIDTLGLLYWKLLPQYVEALLGLSALFEIYGLVQDALYYATQALQVSEAAQAWCLIAKALTVKGSIECRSNDLEQSSLSLSRASKLYEGLGPSKDKYTFQCVLADLHEALEESEDQEKDLQCAERILHEMDAAASQALTDVKGVIQRIPLKPVPHPDEDYRKSRTKVTKVKKASPTAAKAVSRADSRLSDKPSLGQLDLQRRQLQHRFSTGDLESADLRVYGELGCSRASKLLFVQFQVSLLMKQGLELLSRDVVHASLADSTLAIPSCTSYDGQKRAASSIKKGGKTFIDIKDGLSLQLSDAIRLIDSAFQYNNGAASPHITQQMLCDWVTASMTLSWGGPENLDQDSLSSALIAHVIDYAASLAAERGLASTALQYVDASLSSSTQARGMPCISVFDDIEPSLSDMLPSSWNVISMSLSNDHTHIQIVRYLHGKEPFVLRLPLIRQSEHELDDEEDNRFGFLDAKQELLDIIEQSDKIVHKARDSPDDLADKGAKTTWWAEREELDQRLGDLMQNIENMWLGGLKGVFSSDCRDGDWLNKLRSDVERILDNHLPSRQQQKRRKHANKVRLHPSVYELFAGLADVQNGASNELPEAVEDLLYFVVDIAQFHGEHNAYDEIDFDAMTIKTMDAMHAYRESDRQLPSLKGTEQSRHMILVLDKQLQAFPWESLTCLSGRSVSRVCSTLDIKNRIAAMRTPSNPAATQDGISISPADGTYILNPSSDLSRTQTRLEPALQTLTSWTTITNRKPTEAEFSTALSPNSLLSPPPTTTPSHPQISLNTSLLLYFGHGPGTQYIRHRSIKKLRHAPTSCATALLFGCSSAALTIPGQFTEYGTPKSYLHAGAPAVLGSLWDVTDADCDAFARGVLCRWGLCGVDSFPDDEGRGKKGRRKVVKGMRAEEAKARIREEMVEWDGRRVCLAEAVARSRGDCYLRWLNGAAMVVYGVPVFLG